MALNAKLLSILNKEDEPLPKRLKVAENAFKYVELPLQKREVFLVKWLSDLNFKNVDIWQVFYNWISSIQMNNISRSDINEDDVLFINNMIIKKLDDLDNVESKELVVKASLILIENKTFQLFYKHNLHNYFNLLSKLLANCGNMKIMTNLLSSEFLLNVSYTSKKAYKGLVNFVINDLVGYSMRFENDLYNETSQFIEKCLFRKSFKQYESFYNHFFDGETEKSFAIPKILFEKLETAYNYPIEKSKFMYKIIFNAYCNAFSNDFLMIYKFKMIIIIGLGFNVIESINLKSIESLKHTNNTDMSKSLAILSELLEVLSLQKIKLETKIADLSFSDFLKNLLSLLLKLNVTSDHHVCKLFKNLILINPLIVEILINDILIWIMFNYNKESNYKREELFISIIEVFAKLHRIQNLISKMIPIMKQKITGQLVQSDEIPIKFSFDGNMDIEMNASETENNVEFILPKKVLDYFTQCVTSLASWQVINIFKTFLFHFHEYVDKDMKENEESRLTYIELLSILLCQFLSSVRMAEQSVSNLVVNKFVNGMEELKGILNTFGSYLVTMEHNHILMGVFLNIAYIWAELYITLAYYTINNEIKLKTTLDNDFSFCNLTYLHSYLTPEQWNLLSQRITNFGEKPCNQIMHNLSIQKIKAIQIFEKDVNEEIISAIVQEMSLNIEDNWELLISDNYCIKHIIPRLSIEHISLISDLIIEKMIETDNYDVLNNANDFILNGILYNLLVRISKSIKQKKAGLKITKIMQVVVKDCFINTVNVNGTNNLADIVKLFNEELLIKDNDDVKLKYKELKLQQYFCLIKRLPLVYMPNYIRTASFIFLCSLLSDLKSNNSEKILLENIECIIIGLVQNGMLLFINEMKPTIIIKFILKDVYRYEELFTNIIEMIFKWDETMLYFKSGVKYLLKNLEDEKHLKCALILLQEIIKFKKQHVSVDYKKNLNDYKTKICDELENILINSSKEVQSVEAYAFVLKNSFPTQADSVNQLISNVNKYVELAIKEIQTGCNRGGLQLFTIILNNKSQMKIVNNEFVKTVWDICKNLNVDQKDEEDYCKLIILIFDHISNDYFESVTQELLTYTFAPLQNNDYELFTKRVNIWNFILMCSFNPVKNKIWQNSIQTLLQRIILVHDENNKLYFDKTYNTVHTIILNVIRKTQLPLTPSILDICLISINITMDNTDDFINSFKHSITILEALLKFRNALITDRLPSFLQQYRTLLNKLCANSNSDLDLNIVGVQNISDCAHHFEKLTKNIVDCGKHVARISPYLIADILKQYELVTLHPSVKLHLNNCLYNLLKLCDQHAITFLLRILSTASTEIFKMMYDNYKKYFRFTGKV